MSDIVETHLFRPLAQDLRDEPTLNYQEAADTLEWAANRIEALEKALGTLVAQLDLVHADKRYESVWTVSQLHIGQYTGPKYEAELSFARAALNGGKT